MRKAPNLPGTRTCMTALALGWQHSLAMFLAEHALMQSAISDRATRTDSGTGNGCSGCGRGRGEEERREKEMRGRMERKGGEEQDRERKRPDAWNERPRNE